MARQKLFYTKNQITENLYTAGNQFQLENGTVYVGLYHRYDTGEIYTGPNWNAKTSKQLQVFNAESPLVKTYRTNNPNIKTKFKSPTKFFPTITPDDIQRTYISRYFAYKINDQQVIELDHVQFEELIAGKIDNNMFSAIKTVWYITGIPSTIITGNVKTLGVIDKNQSTINRINRQYPGFNNVVNNPLELYVDDTIKVPAPIN